MDHDKHLTSPQITHLRLASPQRFSSAHVPFSAIFSFGRLSSLVHSLAVKVQASSPPKVSRHAFALLAFKPVTSTNQNSFAIIALKAIAKMQVSADSNKTCNAFGMLAHEHQRLNITQPIFQLIDVSVTNFQLILIVDSFQLKQELVNFSSSNAFSIANLNSVSEGVQQVSLIQRFVSSTIYSKSFKLIDVSVPNNNKMCGASQLAANEHKCLNKSNTSVFQLKQELVDFSLSNAFSIAAKLDSSLKDFQCQSSISVNAKANSARLNETPMSQQSTLLYINGGSYRLIVEYINSLNSEGVRSSPTTFTITQALDCQRLIVMSIRDKIPSNFLQ
jgi:hypothetical protein